MKHLLSGIALAIGSLVTASAHADPVVSFNPAFQNVATGTGFTVDIVVSGLGTGPGKDIVSGFDFDILFDGSVLTGVNFTENAALFGFGVFGPADIQANSISLNGTSFENDADLLMLQPNDSYVLATLSFTSGASDGATFLSFGSSIPFQSNLLGALDANGNATTLNASYGTACVTVGAATECRQTVPEPASYALVGVALLAAGFARRRCS